MTEEEREMVARESFMAGVASMVSRGEPSADLDNITKRTYLKIFAQWWARTDL